MKFLWDTNILIHFLRQSPKYRQLNEKYSFFSEENQVYLSIISIGEIQSLAYQLNWGQKRRNQVQSLIDGISILSIYEEIVTAYSKIDAFSQGKLPDIPLPSGISARNMGKNDVWLAATAHAIQLYFVTTDNDFDHLNDVFIKVVKE